MSSTQTRVSRMPEIENIALREALKDFGLEAVGIGDDIVVHVERGPGGLFVSRADKVTGARSRGELFDEIDALCEEVEEGFQSVCRDRPDKAFEFGVSVLHEVVQTVTSMAEKSAIALAEIEARGERIERLNEENKRSLAALVAD